MMAKSTMGRRDFLKTATQAAATVAACQGLTTTTAGAETPGRSSGSIPTRTLGKDEKQVCDAAQFSQGVALSLAPMQAVRVSIRNEKSAQMLADIDKCTTAQRALAHAYQLLQQQTVDLARAAAYTQRFASAMKEYQQRDYDASAKRAGQIAAEIVSPSRPRHGEP